MFRQAWTGNLPSLIISLRHRLYIRYLPQSIHTFHIIPQLCESYGYVFTQGNNQGIYSGCGPYCWCCAPNAGSW